MEKLDSEKLAKIRDIVEDLHTDLTDSNLIQDNKYLFLVENQTYRVKMPTQKEITNADQERKKYRIKLLKDPDTVSRKALIKLLKERDEVDIEELEKQMEKLKQELQSVWLDMAVKYSDEKDMIDKDKAKLEDIKRKFINISIELSEYLDPCIEEQTKKYHREYLTYLCTEKAISEDRDEWCKCWKSFEEFQNDNSKLVYQALKGTETLLMNIYE